MEYQKIQDTFLVRLDPGEEILESLADLAARENIRLAQVSGIGAAKTLEVGVFNTENKTYEGTTYEGYFEISSLTGSITRMDGAPYLHLHTNFANPAKGIFSGGHLNRAVIGATAEIFIRTLGGEVGRKFSEEIGLNLCCFTGNTCDT